MIKMGMSLGSWMKYSVEYDDKEMKFNGLEYDLLREMIRYGLEYD